ncbi:MAG: iron chelate uptake ABC transporter family permease subunit, partial [Prevotella sp.]|nr:iron chelate uptake ABC transporter family permease subunit [Prevotella sp.]
GIVVGIASAVVLVKPLNAMLLGDHYAQNLGIDTRRVRNRLLLTTGLLCAVTTAFCGPIAFSGLTSTTAEAIPTTIPKAKSGRWRSETPPKVPIPHITYERTPSSVASELSSVTADDDK